MIDARLLEVLACPEDKGPLTYFPDREFLYNPRLKREYAINDGIPNMLIEDSVTVTGEEHESLMAEAAKLGLAANFEQ